ncbi:MAG: CRTAC1 family protein [Myxococcota bacterium]
MRVGVALGAGLGHAGGVIVLLALLGCPSSPTPDVPTPPVRGVVLEERSAPVCAQPELRTQGLFRVFELSDATPASEIYVWGGGIVAEDFDGDGRHELITVRDGVAEYLAWDGDGWSEQPGLPDMPLDHAFGAASADLDLDGDLDVLLTRWGAKNHVLENDGSGHFTLTERFGLSGPDGHHSASPSFADIDGDGDLDVLVAGHGYVDEDDPDPTRFAPADDTLVYENRGDGTFVEAPGRLPASAHGRYTFIGGFADFDLDGDPDLLMVNDFGRRYRSGQLLWNDGSGQFVEDGNAAGLDLAVAGMGLGIADVNADSVPDVLVPYWAGYAFMISSGPLWADFSTVTELTPDVEANQTVGWGAMFGDLDNDGLEDAVVMHGYLETGISPNVPVQPDALFQRDGNRYTNRSAVWGEPDLSDSRGVVVADFDGDGWLDYARPDLSGPTRVYMARCGQAAWLEVQLSDSGANPYAVGAVIEVITPETTHWRHVPAGGEGYGSAGPHERHFGLGDAEVVSLRVTWPDGEVSTFDDITTRRRLEITRR